MARIVVAGAGAIGASVAYHLASMGARDVVLADRGRVAGGSECVDPRDRLAVATKVEATQPRSLALDNIDRNGIVLATRALQLPPPVLTDQIVTDRVINELMGKDASARFRFIMERAEEAEELDV